MAIPRGEFLTEETGGTPVFHDSRDGYPPHYREMAPLTQI